MRIPGRMAWESVAHIFSFLFSLRPGCVLRYGHSVAPYCRQCRKVIVILYSIAYRRVLLPPYIIVKAVPGCIADQMIRNRV